MTQTERVHCRLARNDEILQLADLRWRLQTDDAASFDADSAVAERAKFSVL